MQTDEDVGKVAAAVPVLICILSVHYTWYITYIRLIDWLFTVLHPAQEYFTYMETSPLPVKGCKISAYARHSGPLSREGSLSCHTYCDMGLRFFRSHPKDRPIQSPLTTRMGMRRTYSNSDPHGAHILGNCHIKSS
jgi:hypothetical protein